MSVIFSVEELTAMDRAPVPTADLESVSLGHEFLLDDLECHSLLASDLLLNSELTSPAHR